jgi:tetratricopeptide (TPR) repeat protein
MPPREREAAESGSFKLSDSSGTQEVRRKRITGVFDAAAAARTLELLVEKSLHGSIVVSDGFSDVSFFFTRGGLRTMALGKTLPSLAARLTAQGKLDPALAPKADPARKLKDGAAAERREERDILVEVLGLAPSVVDEAAREVIGDVFLDCLFWENPQFEFITGEPEPEVLQRRDLSAVTLSLGVKELITQLQARMRTVSDLRRTVATMQVVVEPLTKGREAAQGARVGDGPLAANRTRLLKKVVAEPGLRAGDLGKKLGIGELEMATHLHELTTQGLVKLDRQPVGKEEELKRLRAMEESLDQALSQLVRRMRVAQEAVQAGDNDRAGKHMARAGGLLLKDGREDEAVRTLQSAVQLAPENLEGREGYVQSLWATNRTAEACGESEELGRRYLELNLPARARRVLEKAVARDEKTSTLQLLVTSLVKLRQPKAATEAGERLVNRLRREGRAEEARDVAGELFELATDSDKQRLMRAAGADRRYVVALLALAFVLVGAFFPASQTLSARTEYDRATRDSSAALRTTRDLAGFKKSLGALRVTFEDLVLRGGEIEAQARTVLDQVALVEKDVARVEKLRELLPWREAPDLDQALKQFEAVRPDSIALAKPLRQLITEVNAFRASAEETRERLLRGEPSPEGLALARKARGEFKGLPALLDRMVVRVRVDSDPAGAHVRWDGIDYSQPTPLVVGVPLRGAKELTLSKEGFQPRSRQVDFEALGDEPALFVTLDPARALPPTPPRTPEPPPQQQPTTPQGDPERTSPGGITVSGPREAPPPPPRVQFEFRDGAFLVEAESNGRFVFDQDAGYLSFIDAPLRYRATVTAVNVVEGTTVFLVGLRVALEVLGSTGWRREKLHEVEFDDRYRRPVIAEGGGRYRVQTIARTLHMSEAWLKEQASDAVAAAIRLAVIRERDARSGR